MDSCSARALYQAGYTTVDLLVAAGENAAAKALATGLATAQ